MERTQLLYVSGQIKISKKSIGIDLRLFIFLVLKNQIHQIQSYQAKYRKVSSLKSYNILSSTKAPKSEMQCCSICSRTLGCEGIMFEGDSCSFLSNPVENMDAATAAESTNNWINTETNAIKSKCKTVQLYIAYIEYSFFS